MSILDDQDPISVLANNIHQLLDRQDPVTALAAVSLVLATLLRYVSAKQPYPANPALCDLRDQLLDLSVEMVRHREEAQES